MAIIYSYPEIPDVQGGDLLLISDTGAPNKPTRSVDIDDLAAYIGTVVGVVQNLQSVLTVGNTYVSPDGYGTFTLNDITNNDGQIKYLNTDEGWGYFLNAEEGLFFTDGTGSQTGSTSIGLGYVSIGNSNHIGEIRSANITANRTYQLPNASGTIALTSDIPTPGPSGSGTTNYTARWTSASALGIGALYDNGTSVGIGINGTYASPPQRLTVVSDDSIQPVAQFKNIGTGGGLFVRTDGTTRPLFELFSGSSYRVVVTGAGNLGIGTTSPSQKLEVAGNVKLDGDNRHIFFGGNNTFIGEKSNSTELELRGGGNSTAQTVYIDNTGQIGVGTSNPSQKLTVLGIGSFGTSTSQTLVDYDGLNAVGNTDYIRFKVDNSEKLRIKSDGNVGIGTTNPSHRLTVVGGVNGRVARLGNLEFTTQAATYTGSSIEVTGSNSFIKYNSTLGHKFFTRVSGGGNTLEALTIAPDTGNVGIGKTSPLAKLHTRSGSSGVGSVDTGTSAIIESNTTNYLRFLSTDSSKAGLVWTTPGDNFAAYLRYGYSDQLLEISTANSNDGISFSTGNASEKMRILSSGNVGIGTTSPAAKLHLSESASGGNPSFILQDNARSGAAALNYILLTDSLNTNQAKIGYLSGLNTELTLQNLVGNTSLISSGQTKIISGTNTLFENSGSERMRITSDGKVGIGTTNPLAKLQVSSTSGWGVFTERGIKDGLTSTYSHSYGAGNAHVLGRSTIFESTVTFSTLTADAQTKEYRLQNSSNKLVLASVVAGITTENNILVASGANIGIGTTSPGAKLDVNGTTYLRSVALDTIFGYSGNNIAFTNTGNTTFNNSNVGIGTTNPQGKLDISTTTSSDIFNLRIHNLTGEVSQSTGILFNTGYTDVSRGKGGLVYEYDTSAGWNRGDFHFLQRQDGASGVARLSDSVLTIKNNGNVGIGTTSPGEKLEVSGNVLAGGGSLNKTIGFKRTDGFNLDLAKIIANGEIRIGGTNVGVITFNRSSNEVMRIASNNNVGIGTTSPSEKLHVEGDIRLLDELIFGEYSTTTDRITNQSYALTMAHSQSINFKVGAASVFNVYETQIRPQVNDTIDLGHDQFRWKRGFFDDNILTNGSIGIGNDYPSAPIHIEASDPRIKIIDTDGTNWESQVFTQGGALKLQARNGTNFGNISFQGDNGTTQSEYARFNSVGNFGIGTNSPSEKLHVAGYAKADTGFKAGNYTILNESGNETSLSNTAYYPMFFKTNNSTRMTISNAGNVGIGTTAPGAKLEVSSTDNVAAIINSTNSFTFLDIENDGANRVQIGNASDGKFIIRTADTERMRIDDVGNVGIGITAPTTKLHVNGDIRIQGENELYFGGTGSVPNWEITASGSDLIVNDTGTNVGSVLFNNDEGVALPRLTTTQINAISSPTQGLMAYNTTLNTICFYNGSSWQKVSHANM